jgi:hypothetical protein
MKKINESTLKNLATRLKEYVAEANPAPAQDPAAVIAKYTDHPELPAYIDSKDGQVKYMDKQSNYGGVDAPKVMPSDWIKRYAPDLADALAAQGGNQQGYGQQQQGNFLGMKFDRGTKVNTAQATNDVSANKDIAQAKQATEKLKSLVAQLKTMSGAPAASGVAGQPAPAKSTNPAPDPSKAALINAATGQVDPSSIKDPNRWGQAESIQESIGRLLSKIRLLEDAAPAGDKEAIMKQISDLMGQITQLYGGDTVPPEVSAVYDDAMATMKQARDQAGSVAGQPAPVQTPGATAWPTTPDEIKKFQIDHKLKVDGLIGKHTMDALTAAGAKPPAGFVPVADKAPAKPAPAKSGVAGQPAPMPKSGPNGEPLVSRPNPKDPNGPKQIGYMAGIGRSSTFTPLAPIAAQPAPDKAAKAGAAKPGVNLDPVSLKPVAKPVMDPNQPGFDFKKASAAANAGVKESTSFGEIERLVSLVNYR